MNRLPFLRLILVLVAAFAGLRSVAATDYTWDPSYSLPPLFYDFENGLSWSPMGHPDDLNDRAIFDSPGDRVTFNANIVNQSFEVRRGTWTFDMTPGPGTQYQLEPPIAGQTAATIGNVAFESATVIAMSNDTDQFLARGTLTLGTIANSAGRLELHGTDWTSDYAATLGQSGWGFLVVDGGGSNSVFNGTRFAVSSLTLGSNSNSLGTATVEDGGSIAVGNLLRVGSRGTGTLTVNDNGSVYVAGDTQVGSLSGANGAVTLTTLHSYLVSLGNMYVGGGATAAGGTGQLTVNSGFIRVTSNLTVWPTGAVDISGSTYGNLIVEGTLSLEPGSNFSLASGFLELASADKFHPAAGTFVWTGGQLKIDTNRLEVGPTTSAFAPLGPIVTLNPGQSLVVPDGIFVGYVGTGQLTLAGGDAQSLTSVVGGPNSATATVTGGGAEWDAGSLLVGGQGAASTTQLVILSGGRLLTSAANVSPVPATAADPALSATVRLEGTDTRWHSTSAVNLGWSTTGDYRRGGVGSLTVRTGATLEVDEALSVGRNFNVSLDGGTVLLGSTATVLGNVSATGSGANTWEFKPPANPASPPPRSLTIDGGNLNLGAAGSLKIEGAPVLVQGNSTLTARLHGDGATRISLVGEGSRWNTSGDLVIDGDARAGAGVLGILTLETGTTVSGASAVKLLGNGVLALQGGTLSAQSFTALDHDLSGFGTISAKTLIRGNVTATGDLTLGNSASFTGVVLDGELNVGPNIVTIRKTGFFNAGTLTTISGGTLTAASGVALPTGHALVGQGAVNARIAAQAGATISTTGNLTLGNTSAVDGFFSDGVLVVGRNVVTIQDANEAVLGELTSLGTAGGIFGGAQPGALDVANGALVEFGKNLVGFGSIISPNAAARPVINNGWITGNSPTEPITLTGYVKGVGTFGHVVFTGTFAPGLSPAAVQLGNAVYDDGSTLVLELGGTSPGTQHDQLLHSGTATLGGTLDIDLLGGYTPALGQQFVLATYANHIGEFDALALPTLSGGLGWSLDYGSTSLVLSVTNSTLLPGDIDLDGDVDRVDASLFAQHFGRTTGSVWSTGDFDADGMTTLVDLATLQSHLGETSLSPVAELVDVPAVGVPEPHSIALLATMVPFVVWRPRRRSK